MIRKHTIVVNWSEIDVEDYDINPSDDKLLTHRSRLQRYGGPFSFDTLFIDSEVSYKDWLRKHSKAFAACAKDVIVGITRTIKDGSAELSDDQRSILDREKKCEARKTPSDMTAALKQLEDVENDLRISDFSDSQTMVLAKVFVEMDVLGKACKISVKEKWSANMNEITKCASGPLKSHDLYQVGWARGRLISSLVRNL